MSYSCFYFWLVKRISAACLCPFKPSPSASLETRGAIFLMASGVILCWVHVFRKVPPTHRRYNGLLSVLAACDWYRKHIPKHLRCILSYKKRTIVAESRNQRIRILHIQLQMLRSVFIYKVYSLIKIRYHNYLTVCLPGFSGRYQQFQAVPVLFPLPPSRLFRMPHLW